MSVSPASRMSSAISFGVFWRAAPSTSAIIRSRNVSPGLGRDAHDDPVGEHARAAGDGRAVAARLADDRRGLAGDRRLVDRCDALDDLAVAGDELAGRDDARRRRARAGRSATSTIEPSSRRTRATRLRARLAQRVGLRLAAPLGHRLGEVGEQHGEPEPRARSSPAKTFAWADASPRSWTNSTVVSDAADLDDEHHRVPRHRGAGRACRTRRRPRADDRRIEQRRACGGSDMGRVGRSSMVSSSCRCSTIGPERERPGRTSGRRR